MSNVWWDLSSWYNACCLEAFGAYGRWAAHGWERWSRQLRDIWGLTESHLQAPLHAAAAAAAPGCDMEKSLDFRAASSFAICCSVAQWVFATRVRGGMKPDTDKQALMLRFKGLVNLAIGDQDHSCTICVDEEVALGACGFSSGRRRRLLRFSGGSVYLSDLYVSHSPLGQRLRMQFSGCEKVGFCSLFGSR